MKDPDAKTLMEIAGVPMDSPKVKKLINESSERYTDTWWYPLTKRNLFIEEPFSAPALDLYDVSVITNVPAGISDKKLTILAERFGLVGECSIDGMDLRITDWDWLYECLTDGVAGGHDEEPVTNTLTKRTWKEYVEHVKYSYDDF